MSFRELLETSQSIAISNRLLPDEQAIWNKYCREFSKRFNTSLTEVHKLSPEFVLTELFSDYLADWDVEDKLEDIFDMIGSLKDPGYDAAKEKAIRDELKKLEEDERLRLEENRPVHDSLVVKKFGDKPKEEKVELPKSGGINSELIRRLQNDDNEY